MRVKSSQSGFTLLEIIIVIALLAGVYVVALPSIGIKTDTEVANKLARLTSDVKAAYDRAVLTGKNHRLVFHLISGDYWLEFTDSQNVLVGDEKIERDLTPEEEKEEQEAFDQKFEEYVGLAGESYSDPEKDDITIPPVSPVLKAKDDLRRPEWFVVKTAEWKKRSLGETLIIGDFDAEHLQQKVNFLENGEDTIGVINIYPAGYVEKAVMYLFYRKGDADFDEDQEPYTVQTMPFEGVADATVGREEINVRAEK